MAGINQGRPETAIGEPIRLGSNNDFELEQHPVSDRLIIRNTENDTGGDTVAYIRGERGQEIGGDGELVKALKNSEPMADDGYTYSTIQDAENAASSWVFVPPGVFNESVSINTEGLSLIGSGFNSVIDGATTNHAVIVNAPNCTVRNLQVKTTAGAGNVYNGFEVSASDTVIDSCTVPESDKAGISSSGKRFTATNVKIESCDSYGIKPEGEDSLVTNCIVRNVGGDGVTNTTGNKIIANSRIISPSNDGISISGIVGGDNIIISGNRVDGSGDTGIYTDGSDSIIANNRVSGSTNSDIDASSGTNIVLDGNITGGSN